MLDVGCINNGGFAARAVTNCQAETPAPQAPNSQILHPTSNILHLCLARGACGCSEDGGQSVSLCSYCFHFARGHNTGIYKQLHPVFALIGLFFADFELGQKVRSAFRMASGAVVCPHTGAAAKELLAEHVGICATGQGLPEFNYTQCKIACSFHLFGFFHTANNYHNTLAYASLEFKSNIQHPTSNILHPTSYISRLL